MARQKGMKNGERAMQVAELARCNWHCGAIAKELGISRQSVWSLARSYGIDIPHFSDLAHQAVPLMRAAKPRFRHRR